MLVRRLFVGTTLLVSFSGCGPSLRPGNPATQPTVVLYVQNRHWEDVRVFIVRNDVPLSLGTVSAMSTGRFSVPDSYVGSGLGLRLLVQAFASRSTHLSQEITVPFGARVDWTVEGRLSQSSFLVRPPS